MSLPSATRAATGFTLIELLLTMGILSGFLLMLAQFVGTGIDVFDEGENGQAMADRAMAAARDAERELLGLQGPGPLPPPGEPPARLLVQWLPLGLVPRPEPHHTFCQLLRADAALEPARERALLQGMLRAQAEAEAGELGEAAVTARLQELLARTPLHGRGGLWLLPWPSGDQEGAYLQLRVLRLLPGQLLETGRDQWVDPMKVAVPGGPELPMLLIDRLTEVVTDGLLHFELEFWSQRTTADGRGEVVWDSARAGWLSDPKAGPAFDLDVGPHSMFDPTDDVYPAAIRCRLVVAQDPRLPAEGMLARELEAGETSLRLLSPDRFPGPADGGHVKVGPEWIRYESLTGSELRGLKRGQRGTRPRSHNQGVRVRVGRTVEFTVPVPFARENWNG